MKKFNLISIMSAVLASYDISYPVLTASSNGPGAMTRELRSQRRKEERRLSKMRR